MKFRGAGVIKCFAKNYQQYLIEDGVRYSLPSQTKHYKNDI